MHYLQSQNGNLFTNSYFDVSAAGGDDGCEFEPLRAHVPSEVPWCSDTLGERTHLHACIGSGAPSANAKATQTGRPMPSTCGSATLAVRRAYTAVSSASRDAPPPHLCVVVTRACTTTDPYENIYTVVRGTKHFTLFPPTESWCMRGEHRPPDSSSSVRADVAPFPPQNAATPTQHTNAPPPPRPPSHSSPPRPQRHSCAGPPSPTPSVSA